MQSGLTPEAFLVQVQRAIITNAGDPQTMESVLTSLMEDTLVEFGYEEAVELIRDTRA